MSIENAVQQPEVTKVKKDKKDKKDKKRSKEDKSVAAVEADSSSMSIDASSLPPATATGTAASRQKHPKAVVAEVDAGLNGDEPKKSKKDKKAKKDKKRKLEAEAEAGNETPAGNSEEPSSASALNTGASSTPAPANNDSTPVEDGSKKKKRKKNVQGAFGNERKKQKTQEGAAVATTTSSAAETSSAPTGSLSQSEIDAFVKESDLTYEPSTSSSTYPPVLSFDALPVAPGIKAGLSSFTKPTIVQSASWGVQLVADANTRPKDIVSIAATG